MRTITILLLLLIPFAVHAQQRFELSSPASADDARLAKDLPELAKRIIPTYSEANPNRYLSNLFRLQMVAGDYAGARSTLDSIHVSYRAANPPRSPADLAPDELMLRLALTKDAAALREYFSGLTDKEASNAIYWLWGSLPRFRASVKDALSKVTDQQIDLAAALNLIRSYQLYVEYSTLGQYTDALIREDDEKRYEIQKEVRIPTRDNATLCALVVRPRNTAGRLSTALNFTIYAGVQEMDKARSAAANGYTGVIVKARGKACSPDKIIPWEREASDAYDAIDWVSKQPWSDKQVGMFGGSYEGFTQWAAVKRVHPALKTIVPWAATHPGISLPMANNVFQSANYQWAPYVTNNKYTDDQANDDEKRWAAMNERWYASGRPYREIDQVDGAANPVLQRQLKHPAFDEYWQSLAAYRTDFARINIPVLQIAGYFDPAHVPGLYYLNEHYTYNKRAEHYLIIGPYDHFGTQQADKPRFSGGYVTDPVASFDTIKITYEWFDYVMKGGRKPELLQDKINYEVMGANVWKHAASVRDMSNATLKLYLSDGRIEVPALAGSDTAELHPLSEAPPKTRAALEQTVDFADRSPSSTISVYPDGVVSKSVPLKNVLTFVSSPFGDSVSIAGAISGTINAVINKKDMDVTMAFYELEPDGALFSLGYYVGRASFAADPTRRHLLKPGAVASIPIRGTPMYSRQMQKGSRLLVQLSVNKNRFNQINYGTGKDVSDESIEDAKQPLKVQWQTDSFVTVPVSR